MDATPILTKLKEDAAKQASDIINAAKQRTDEIKQQANKRISEMRENDRVKFERESAAMQDRMLRMSELENKKDLLSSKRELVSSAFDRALELLYALPDKEKKEFFLRQILSLASGDEALQPAEKSKQLFDEHFILEINEALKKSGKNGLIRLSHDNFVSGTGFILKKDGVEINCTFEAIVNSKRQELEGEVAKILFSGDL
jgi:V/A-type H+-transporting ATPase subunit E